MRRPALLVLPLALALAACGGEDDVAAPATSPSEVATASATATSSAAPTAAGTPSRTAARARAADGDVDGDGKVDRTSFDGSTLVVSTSGPAGDLRAPVDGDDPVLDPQVTGVVDVDLDGHADVFVRVGQGASTSTLRLFRYDGRELRPVSAGDRPFLLTVGGTVTHGDGFSCTDDGRVVVRSAVSDEGTAFRVTTTTYVLRGFEAVQQSRTTTTAQQGSPEVGAAYQVECGSVTEGE